MKVGPLVVLFIIFSLPLSAADFTFVTFDEDQIQFNVYSEVLRELYKRLGYTITIEHMSSRRAAMESSSGLVDGEVGRIYNFNSKYPHLLRIPTSYASADTMAFIRKDCGISAVTADDLKKYRVARIRGIVNTDRLTVGVEKVFDFDSIETMMEFVGLKRADIALVNRLGGMQVLLDMDNTDIIPLEPPVSRMEIYHFVYDRDSFLIPLLDSLIKEMKRTGELDQLIRETEKRLISRKND